MNPNMHTKSQIYGEYSEDGYTVTLGNIASEINAALPEGEKLEGFAPSAFTHAKEIQSIFLRSILRDMADFRHTVFAQGKHISAIHHQPETSYMPRWDNLYDMAIFHIGECLAGRSDSGAVAAYLSAWECDEASRHFAGWQAMSHQQYRYLLTEWETTGAAAARHERAIVLRDKLVALLGQDSFDPIYMGA